MPGLVRGRFRTAVEGLPAARQRYFCERYAGLLSSPPIRRLIALYVTLSVLDAASQYGQLIVGGSTWRAKRRSFLPLLRYFDSFLPLLFDEARDVRPAWVSRIQFTGLDRLVALRESGTPVLLAVPHLSYSHAAICRALASRGIPVAINTVAPHLFRRIPGTEAFDPDDALHSFLALRSGSVLVYGADVAGPGVVCRLFGRYASFPAFFAEIAARTRAAVMVAWCSGFRSTNVKIVIEKPVPVEGRAADEVTREIVRRLEAPIRRQPFEWFPAGPFLDHTGFCETGRLSVLVGVLGGDDALDADRCADQLATYPGFDVAKANLGDMDVLTLVERVRAGGYDVLLLARPPTRTEIGELSFLVNRIFRFPTDWVAYEPEGDSATRAGERLTTFSLSLVKTAVLEALVQRGVRRLDADALRCARRMGWHCHHVPSTERILRDIRRLRARGVDVSDLVR